jgi:hypothetical protein
MGGATGLEYWLSFLMLFGAAILIGILASMTGIGGGGLMVPLLALTHLVESTQEAVGTTLIPIVFNAFSSTLAYWRQGVIDLRFGLSLMPVALGGGWLGAYLTEFISSSSLALAFGIFFIYPTVIMLAGYEPKELGQLLRRKQRRDGRPHSLAGSLIGFLAGFAAGFFGIGGGIVMVPAMNLVLGIDIVSAVATSLFVMGPPALIGSIQHGFLGNLHWEYALPLLLGVMIGAQLGPLATARLPKKRLRQFFGIVVLGVAINMIWKGLH